MFFPLRTITGKEEQREIISPSFRVNKRTPTVQIIRTQALQVFSFALGNCWEGETIFAQRLLKKNKRLLKKGIQAYNS